MSDRPLSPHLQVYKPQITSILSITHRATGVVLSVTAITVVWSLYKAAAGPEGFAQVQACWSSLFGKLLLTGTTFCVWFHFANGIRHLFWDAGKGLEIETAYKSGYAVIAFTLLATAATGALILTGGGA